MTPPADIPQWAWDEAGEVIARFMRHERTTVGMQMLMAGSDLLVLRAIVARALLSHYERGRVEKGVAEQRDAYESVKKVSD